MIRLRKGPSSLLFLDFHCYSLTGQIKLFKMHDEILMQAIKRKMEREINELQKENKLLSDAVRDH